MIWGVWWVWLVAALILGVLEMLAPAFVLLGFAVGAAVVGLGLLTGVLAGFSLAGLLVVCTAMSLVSWIVLRRVFRVEGDAAKTFDYDIND